MTDLVDSHDGTIVLGEARRVPPREIAVGLYVYRQRPDGTYAGWYKVLDVTWQPDDLRYQVRFERPEALRTLLPDRYHLSYGMRETVRAAVAVKDVTP